MEGGFVFCNLHRHDRRRHVVFSVVAGIGKSA
jgi:hypothetical protein